MSAEHVESVDIVFDETLGLEGRAGYYDGTRRTDRHDPEPPPPGDVRRGDGSAEHDRRARRPRRQGGHPARHARSGTAIRSPTATAPATPPERSTGASCPHYVDEDGIDPATARRRRSPRSSLEIDTWRWAGVPFRLRSGKALGNPRQEVVVTFKQAHHLPTGFTGGDQPGRLHIGIALDAGR